MPTILVNVDGLVPISFDCAVGASAFQSPPSSDPVVAIAASSPPAPSQLAQQFTFHEVQSRIKHILPNLREASVLAAYNRELDALKCVCIALRRFADAIQRSLHCAVDSAHLRPQAGHRQGASVEQAAQARGRGRQSRQRQEQGARLPLRLADQAPARRRRVRLAARKAPQSDLRTSLRSLPRPRTRSAQVPRVRRFSRSSSPSPMPSPTTLVTVAALGRVIGEGVPAPVQSILCGTPGCSTLAAPLQHLPGVPWHRGEPNRFFLGETVQRRHPERVLPLKSLVCGACGGLQAARLSTGCERL